MAHESTRHPSHTTVIIGGGVSGIVQAKWILSLGVPTEIHLFEGQSTLGGVWDVKRRVGGVMECTVCNVSKYTMELSGHPWPEGTPDFPHHTQVLAYIRSYAERFIEGSPVHLHLSTQVELVERRLEDGSFRVSYRDIPSGMSAELIADQVLVANGHSSTPHFPLAGVETRGCVTHSATYKSPDGVAGGSVLVVGLSFSAVDVAVDLARECGEVSVVTRNGTWFLPKATPDGVPSDITLPRIFTHLPHTVQNQLIKLAANRRYFDQTSWAIPTVSCQPAEGSMVASPQFVGLVRSGKISVIHGSVLNVEESGDVTIQAQDDVIITRHFDHVIFCTGFSPNFEFLAEDLRPGFRANGRPDLYLQMFRTDNAGILETDLAFVGLFNVRYTSPLQVIDLQCLYTAQLMAGTATLPAPTREPSGHQDTQTFRGSLFTASDYRDRLAGLCGRLPSSLSPLRSPRQWIEFHFGPVTWAGYWLDTVEGREALRRVCEVVWGRGWWTRTVGGVTVVLVGVIAGCAACRLCNLIN